MHQILFAIQVSRIEDTVSWRPGAIHDQIGVRQRVLEVVRNMQGLFSGSVRRPMLLMIYINFAIQFGQASFENTYSLIIKCSQMR